MLLKSVQHHPLMLKTPLSLHIVPFFTLFYPKTLVFCDMWEKRILKLHGFCTPKHNLELNFHMNMVFFVLFCKLIVYLTF